MVISFSVHDKGCAMKTMQNWANPSILRLRYPQVIGTVLIWMSPFIWPKRTMQHFITEFSTHPTIDCYHHGRVNGRRGDISCKLTSNEPTWPVHIACWQTYDWLRWTGDIHAYGNVSATAILLILLIYVRLFANSRQKDRQRKIKQTDSKNNTARHSVRQPN